MAASQAGGEGPGGFQGMDVARVDLIQRAEPRAGIILGGHGPLPVVGLVLDLCEAEVCKKENRETDGAGTKIRFPPHPLTIVKSVSGE